MGTTRITFLLTLGATLLAASTEPPVHRSDVGPTMTVTAEAEPVEVVQTPNPVTVVDKKAIEASGATTLSELLKDVLPGQVLSTGGPGTSTSLYLGGARPQDTVVTLDGLRLTDASGLGGVNLGILGLAGVDRAEIQRGPCSTRFGSEALGGVVALYTAGSAPKGFSGEIAQKVGTRGTAAAQAGLSYAWESGWLRASGGAERADAVTKADHRYRAVTSSLGFGQQLGDSTLMTLNYFNSYAGVPLPLAFASYGVGPRPSYAYNEKRGAASRLQAFSGSLRTAFSETVRGELNLGQVEQVRLEPLPDGKPGRRYVSRRHQLQASTTWDLSPKDALTLGVEAYEESASTPDAVNAELRNDATARHLALNLDGGFELLEGWRLVASLRSQRDRQTIHPQGATTEETSIAQTTGKVGVNWTPTEHWRFYTSLGTGFSNPLLSQSLWNAHYGGESLENEKSRYLQMGTSWQSGPWSARLDLSRTLFSSLVYYDPDGGVYIPDWWMNSGVYRNGTDIRIQSAEIRAGYSVPAWGLEGFYRNQEARDLKAPHDQRFKTNAVIRRPFQTFGLSGYRVFGRLRLDGQWTWFGPRYEYGLTSGFNTHFNDVSLSAKWTVSEQLSFTLRGEHLLQPKVTKEDWMARKTDFDNDASMVFGYPSTPATWTLEARYRF